MTQITVSVKDTSGLKAAVHGVLSVATVGYLAWHGGDAPADAAAVALAASYSHLTALRINTAPAKPKRPKGQRRA